MLEQLVIDPARFAGDRARLTGSLATAGLPRLADQLGDDEGGSIRYAVDGFNTPRGQPALRVKLDGALSLRCQRCLGPLPYRLDTQRDIVLVEGADEFAQSNDEDESTDIIPAVPRLNLRTLLEEEVLLVLPVAPRHAEGECRPDDMRGTTPERSSPFAALARLKG